MYLVSFSNKNKSDFTDTTKVEINNKISFVLIVLFKLKSINPKVANATGKKGWSCTNLQNSTTENSKKMPKSKRKL